MAGFFGFFDYTKPGPGVPKDAPPKPRIVVFFEIYSRKFWNLVKLNMLFFLFNLPAVIGVLFLSMFFMRNIISNDPVVDLISRFILGTVVMCIPLVTVGPAQAGFTYVLRNYAREEHAFIWWDFKENALKNFKESMIICIIDFFVVLLVGIDFNMYSVLGRNNIFLSFASGILILGFIIYLMMHMYIYPMLVTFKLGVKQIYKNSMLFAIMNFLPNLGILIICVLLLFITFYNTLIGFILYPFLTISTIGLITNFYVYPHLKKHIMDKAENVETAGIAENSENQPEE